MLSKIKTALKQAPFEPFNILLDNGAKISVSHPECVIVSPAFCLALDSSGVPWTVGMEHVGGINHDTPKGRRKSRRAK